MRIIKLKCDICGRIVEEYYQIRFRKVLQQTTGKSTLMEICEECMRKTALQCEKDVNIVS